MAEPTALKYRAFISYSHADTPWAKWLHRALEGFRIDKDLAGRKTATGIIPKALRPIFRDRDDFSAGHSLNDQTLAALNASAALIVICSPSAAKSPYVNEEIRLFKAKHPERPVIPLIVGGKPGDPELECFSPAISRKVNTQGKITDEPIELLAADAREVGDGKNLALAKIVAGLLGVSSDDVFRRAERERLRKGRVRNGIVAVLVILVAAASGSALYARHQLKNNEAFLTATLKTATEIVDEAVAQAEKYGVPRTATLALLTKAEGLFDNMALLGRPTPELRYQKAWMLIQFARNYAVLGDAMKQKARADEAHRLMAELVLETPEDRNTQIRLAGALYERGNALRTQGDYAAALKAYQDCFAISNRLAKADPSDLERQRDLSTAYTMIGNMLKVQGDLVAALKAHQNSLAIVDHLAKAEPSNARWQRDLWMSYGKIADILIDQGNLAAGLFNWQAAHVITSRLAEADPSNTAWLRDLSVSQERMGDVHLAKGDLLAAQKYHQDSLAITARLAKLDPSNGTWQVDLSVGYRKVGHVLKAQGNLAAALKAYQNSLAVANRLAKADPHNTVWQSSLLLAYESVREVLEAKGKYAAAHQGTEQTLSEYRQTREIIARLKERYPYYALLTNDLARYDAEIAKLEQAGALGESATAQPEQTAR